MPDARRLVYWDANVFLDYIEGNPTRLPVLDALLDDSANPRGTIQIVTSTISIVEVAFAVHEKINRILDSHIEVRLNDLWTDEQAVKLAEFHDLVAIEARALMRRGLEMGMRLKPMDAIHLATAARLEVAEFHTYDASLRKYAPIVGFPIVEPHTLQPRLFGGTWER
jgi:predicted nucleic acid-binding protein